jgi:hypothetical protein
MGFDPHELRDPLGRWVDGGGLGKLPNVDFDDAVAKWVDPETFDDVSDAAMHELETGRPGDGDGAAEAHALIHAMADSADVSRAELHRGIFIWNAEMSDFRASYAEGSTFDAGLISFSEDEKIAREFSYGVAGRGASVLFHLDAGASGLDIGTSSLENEAEWITAGRFRVASVTEDEYDDSLLHIRIQQEDADASSAVAA